MAEEPTEGVTDEKRAQVRQVLFDLLRKNGMAVGDEVDTFQCEFFGEYGVVRIQFDMGTRFADWAIRTSEAVMNRRFESAADALVSKGQLESKPTSFEKTKHDIELAGFLGYFAIAGMAEKLKSALYELGLETEQVFDGLLLLQLEKTGLSKQGGYEVPSIADEVRALSKSIADERKQFLTAQINSFKRKPRFDRMPEIYPRLLKVWQSAKKIYEDNGESETWRDMVKVKYPELTFDDDLLIRVTGKLEDLTEDVRAKLIETDGDHTPNTIALEHSARMCGASPYQHGTRHYHNLKTPKTEREKSE